MIIPVTGADLSLENFLANTNLQPVLDGGMILAAIGFMLYGLLRYLKK